MMVSDSVSNSINEPKDWNIKPKDNVQLPHKNFATGEGIYDPQKESEISSQDIK